MKILLAIMAVGILPAAALAGPTDDAAAEKLARYERTGETVSCLSLARISTITPVTESTFLFRVGVNDYYVNDVSGPCHGATRRSSRLQYSTSLSQLCRNDIIKVVDNGAGFTTGSCGLGSFEKLAEKPTEAELQQP